jgi:organic radical activating enzyme
MRMKGYISEIFSSFQGEGGSIRGSCQGKRQIFIRFAGCNLAELKKPCIWCDSLGSQDRMGETVRVEKSPGNKEFEALPNPMDVNRVLESINGLKTSDLHSLSITGGEPLHQADFLESLCMETEQKIYLETNGTFPEEAKRIADRIDYACVDIKDESANPHEGWKEIVEKELKSIGYLKGAGVNVFAKVVVTSSTEPENIGWYARELKEMGVPLAIQPVTTENPRQKVNSGELFRLTEAAAQYLSADEVTISLQTHKFYRVL